MRLGFWWLAILHFVYKTKKVIDIFIFFAYNRRDVLLYENIKNVAVRVTFIFYFRECLFGVKAYKIKVKCGCQFRIKNTFELFNIFYIKA